MKNKSFGESRQNFNRMTAVLKVHGYKNSMDLYDFFAKNEEKIKPTRYGQDIYEGIFSKQIRWYYVNGTKLQKSIREYIERKVSESDKRQMKLFLNGETEIQKQVIDFSDWECEIQGHKYTSANSRKIPIATQEGGFEMLLDFCGVDLSGIKITDCEIRNVCFDGAFFDEGTILSSVDFTNVGLVRASFHKAFISEISLGGVTKISGAYFDGARIERIKNLSNSTVTSPINYSEPTYWWLIKELFIKMLILPDWTKRLIRKVVPKWRWKEPDEFLYNQRHTTFIGNQTESLTSPGTKEFKDYIHWFQSLTLKIYGFKTLKRRKRVGFFLALASTKYWSSFKTLGFFALFLDFIFSIIYFLRRADYKDLDIAGECGYFLSPVLLMKTFIKAFYYSTVTFMTLGYGDVYPLTWDGQILVIIEVTLGYIVLGLFVYLVSRKVDKLY